MAWVVERIAAKWEAELQDGRYRHASKITWAEFREQYEEQKLATLADKTQESAATAMNHLERVVNPKRLISLTSATLSRLQTTLRKEGMKDTTIAAYLAHIRPAFGWAVSMGMSREAPDMHPPKRAKGRKLMRGRPNTTEEFKRMINAVPKVRKHDPTLWERCLTGLWMRHKCPNTTMNIITTKTRRPSAGPRGVRTTSPAKKAENATQVDYLCGVFCWLQAQNSPIPQSAGWHSGWHFHFYPCMIRGPESGRTAVPSLHTSFKKAEGMRFELTTGYPAPHFQ